MASNRKGVVSLNGLPFFKTVFTIIILCIMHSANAQDVYASMRTGWASKSNQPFVSPAIDFTANNISLGAEMIVNVKDNSPCQFGIRASYQYQFIEAGVARYFELFSMDKYDENLNGWVNTFFIDAHYKLFFVQYEYLHGNRYSFGMKENLNWRKD